MLYARPMLFQASRSATLAGLGAILLWSLLALLTAATVGIPPFQVMAITFAIGGLTGLAVLAARHRLAELVQPPAAWALGLYGLFCYHAIYFTALKLAPPAEASLVAYLWPLLIVLMSGLLPGGGLSLRHVIAALMGLAGMALLALGKGALTFSPEHRLGYGLALVSAFIWSSYSVLSRRMASVPNGAVVGHCLATAGLAALCHLTIERWVTPTPSGWLALVGLGLGPVGAAFFLWDTGMKLGDLRFLGVASYATPVLSTLVLVATGTTTASLSLALACLLIAGGAFIARR